MHPFDQPWPMADAVQLACMLEASAPKVGNVHPGASFSDMQFAHFVASAITIRAPFDSPTASVGRLVLEAAQTTAKRVGRNTNLGTLLLFAPLAVAHRQAMSTAAAKTAQSWRGCLEKVLNSLTSTDCQLVYDAIRTAKPGGLGQRSRDDIASTAPPDLVSAMQQVSDIDAVARQYTNAFADVFERLLPWLNAELQQRPDPLEAICRVQIRWLAHEQDGLVVRKVGEVVAKQVQELARLAWKDLTNFQGKVSELPTTQNLDHFLRGDAHRRNPGTTADLIAATLLVRLVLGRES